MSYIGSSSIPKSKHPWSSRDKSPLRIKGEGQWADLDAWPFVVFPCDDADDMMDVVIKMGYHDLSGANLVFKDGERGWPK